MNNGNVILLFDHKNGKQEETELNSRSGSAVTTKISTIKQKEKLYLTNLHDQTTGFIMHWTASGQQTKISTPKRNQH